MGDYTDIISAPRPELNHLHMDIRRRAKQFAPFAALSGFDSCIADKEIRYRERPILSEEQSMHLDRKLHMIRIGMNIKVTYFMCCKGNERLGQVHNVEGEVLFFEPELYLRVGDVEIIIESIIELEGAVFDDVEQSL